jgi:hypothetical protein
MVAHRYFAEISKSPDSAVRQLQRKLRLATFWDPGLSAAFLERNPGCEAACSASFQTKDPITRFRW